MTKDSVRRILWMAQMWPPDRAVRSDKDRHLMGIIAEALTVSAAGSQR